jgi:hypothetical protein
VKTAPQGAVLVALVQAAVQVDAGHVADAPLGRIGIGHDLVAAAGQVDDLGLSGMRLVVE